MQNSEGSASIPSIFNDVIGPVMRGPSSSHCAAALRIGRMARDLMGGDFDEVYIEFDSKGSLATTHESQGSDIGMFGGLLGMDAVDERLAQSPALIMQAGIRTTIAILDNGEPHPNTYRLILKNARWQVSMVAISTGGGMIEVIAVDDAPLVLSGDYHETLVFMDSGADEMRLFLDGIIESDEMNVHNAVDGQIVEIKTQNPLAESTLTALGERFKIRRIAAIAPVLPVLSRRNLAVPFLSCADMLRYNADKNLALWELAVRYESARASIPHAQVLKNMRDIVIIMQNSIAQGLAGTVYADRILGFQSGGFKTLMESGRLLDGGALNRIILYVSAMMETKSSFGVIVAAPTAGSCGGLPGACIGLGHAMALPVDDMAKAMLAAGLIGVFIAARATFSAEIGGCQAECGSGSGMAAAALVTLAQGSVAQALGAASMALQNSLGMICDPVAARVEVPCLGKNVMAASNAFACANMALADFESLIPLDEVIETMDRVGKSLPSALRCTALGGLSLTQASKEIEKRFEKGGHCENCRA